MSTHRYELFIRTTPAALWEALTSGAKTKQYFFKTSVVSSLTAGAAITWLGAPDQVVVQGTVLEADAPRRLVHTWSAQYDPVLAKEISTVTWLIEPRGSAVKLTVEHALGSAPATAAHVATDGWSVVLSGLKTLLETGAPLVLPPSNM
jgi:uncharacterized protein YndB with AHSA1/START domain